eukprot:5744039-Amphidinium_carterae.1
MRWMFARDALRAGHQAQPRPIKMSGGTAAFYSIELVDAVANGASKRYWIGRSACALETAFEP